MDNRDQENQQLRDLGLFRAQREMDVEPTYGEPVRLEGRCEIDPIPGGKRFQGTWLVLDDGTRYVIAYRPVPRFLQFVDKRVVVQGRPYMPGRDTQHIQAQHLAVDAVELAPGETPHVPPPTEVPAPPVARTAAGLAARHGRWVRVAGTLEWVREDPEGYRHVAQVRLADGTVAHARNVRRDEWGSLQGQAVMVTSRVGRLEDGGPPAFELFGWHAIQQAEE